MIETHGVGKLYETGLGTVGLHELDLDVQPARVVALLGHNGAGKTTAVRGLTTLLRFDRAMPGWPGSTWRPRQSACGNA